MRALAGRRVVVTRARRQAGELSARLRALGAEVVELPAIEIEPLDFALPDLSRYAWVVFTSRNGVEAVAARRGGGPLVDTAGPHVAAIGPGTAAALEALGVRPALVPGRYVAEALVEAFPVAPSGPRPAVLLLRAAQARDVLPEGLAAKGWEVDVVPVYRTVTGSPEEGVLRAVRRGEVDVLTFTSSSTVANFLQLVGRVPEPQPPAVCIGPVTAETAERLGLRVAAVSGVHTIDGLVATVAGLLAPRVGE